jgi:hypothetical protein
MNLWPEKSFIITTQLSPEEVIEKIRNLIEAPRKHDDIYFPIFTSPQKRDYFGIITENKFRIFVDLNSAHYSKIYEKQKKKYNLMISPESRKKDIIAFSNFIDGEIKSQNNLTIIHFSFRNLFSKLYLFVPTILLLLAIVALSLLKDNITLVIAIIIFCVLIVTASLTFQEIENLRMKKFLTLFFANALH